MANETKQELVVKKGTPAHKVAARPMRSPFDEMDRLFERMLPRGWMRPFGYDAPLLEEYADWRDAYMPRVDVLDNEDNVTIRAEVPGVDKKDIELSVNDTSATIKGKVMREAKEESVDYYRREISTGEFSRMIELPCVVDGTKASAHLKDGMLEIVLPKVEKSKRHAIKID